MDVREIRTYIHLMKAKVLIITADTEFRESVMRELNLAHLEGLTVRSGVEAIRVLKTEDISFVICDNDLIGMDAMQFLCVANILLRSRPPVVVCSSRHRYSPEEFRHNGASEVFSKPFYAQHLRAFLRRMEELRGHGSASPRELSPLALAIDL